MNVKGAGNTGPFIFAILIKFLTQDIREDADSFYLLVKKRVCWVKNRQ
uniref:Uncharacterized protein n=1 Tax=Klebsiella pneumoniae TaxID=573 RepID=A0A8B0SXT8_KLEPN|nr:hypothetical protein [Klebsiella pneumoniae]